MISLDRHYWIICDIQRLSDPAYFAAIAARYSTGSASQPHSHVCQWCKRTITHSRLEALRDGEVESHLCCGQDVRAPQLKEVG